MTKVRSLLLTALMVMSVFAGATAFAGSAVAAESGKTISDNTVVYQGQVGLVNAFGAEKEVTLSKGKDGGNGFVDTYTADTNGEFTIDTSELETGFYQLSGDDGSGTTVTITFQVVQQSFDVSADSTTLMENSEDQSVSFSIDDSNRENFDVSVYSEEITGDDSAIDSFSGMHEEGDGPHTFDLDLSSYDLSPGTYNVTVSVDDTTASQTFEITVKKGGSASSSFGDSVYNVPRGDIVPITVNLENTKSATATVGSAESNFEMTVDVTDNDDDGKVTFWLNTYQTTNTDASKVIYAGANSEDGVTAAWETPSSGGLEDPIAVTSGDNIYELSVDTNNDGTPDDVASLSVDPRSTGSAQTWIAPNNLESYDDAPGLTSQLTQRSNVAKDDHIVVQLKDTTGIYGALAAQGFGASVDDVEGLSLSIKEVNPEPNTEVNSLNSNSAGVKVFADGKNNTLYAVIDTSAVDFAEQSDADEDFYGDWKATFHVSDASSGGYAVTPDDDQYASTTFTVEQPSFELNDGNDLKVANSDNQTVTGMTNLAPGTSVNLRARSSGVFFKNQDVTVSEDGSFTGTFDFSGYENGTEFGVTASATGVDSVSVDGVLNANLQETTTTTTTTTTESTTEEPTSTTEEPTSTTEEPTSTTTTSTNDDGQPGFGVAVSVVALLAAALLALRREN
ncbi:BGTF surface domain-containing protein [Haladaptatus sp. NG-SE-30]